MTSKENRSKPKPIYQGVRKRRACLSCQQQFMSEWPGNRRCQQCKTLKEWGGSHVEEYQLGQ